jgi:hypothetical protein
VRERLVHKVGPLAHKKNGSRTRKIARAEPEPFGPKLAAMAAEDLALLKERMGARLPADAAGRITCSARANAIKGRVL